MYSKIFQINSSALLAFWKAEFFFPLQSLSARLLHFCFMFCFLSMATWILWLKASFQFVNSKRIFLLIPVSYEQRSLSEASNNCVNFSLLTLNKEEGWSDLWRHRKVYSEWKQVWLQLKPMGLVIPREYCSGRLLSPREKNWAHSPAKHLNPTAGKPGQEHTTKGCVTIFWISA